MQLQTRLKIQLELVWWFITALVAALVTYPLWGKFTQYKFLYANILFVVLFITFTRHLFLLKHTFLAYWQPAKFVLIFLCIPLIFHQVELISNFQEFLDDEGLNSFDQHLRPDLRGQELQSFLAYVRREYLFFGVSSVIASVFLPFRLLISYWRVYNKKGRV